MQSHARSHTFNAFLLFSAYAYSRQSSLSTLA
jgi:hypothetical protein